MLLLGQGPRILHKEQLGQAVPLQAHGKTFLFITLWHRHHFSEGLTHAHMLRWLHVHKHTRTWSHTYLLLAFQNRKQQRQSARGVETVERLGIFLYIHCLFLRSSMAASFLKTVYFEWRRFLIITISTEHFSLFLKSHFKRCSIWKCFLFSVSFSWSPSLSRASTWQWAFAACKLRDAEKVCNESYFKGTPLEELLTSNLSVFCVICLCYLI